MIARFSLYGFLKNLRLFEAFLVLALLERGLDFLAIGGLIAVREIAINLFEVPSGAFADGYGRKRCLVLSMAAYLVAYVVLGLAQSWWVLAAAMVVYGIGDAFRSGTHKALIYAWLRQQHREAERTRVYGYTRSWSKIGSALSALAGAAVLVMTSDYRWIFLASAFPAALNLINLATYPASLDRPIIGSSDAWRGSFGHLYTAFRTCARQPRLRRLITASMGMEGGYAAAKDYLQPLLQTLAIAMPLGLSLDGQQRSAVIVGLVAAVLFLGASIASRHAHRLEAWLGGDDRSAHILALSQASIFAFLGLSLALGTAGLAVAGFVLLGIIQSCWRPIHVGRFDQAAEEAHATTLSIEAQAKALATTIFAPIIGACIDASTAATPEARLWPVALLGLPLLIVIGTGRRKAHASDV